MGRFCRATGEPPFFVQNKMLSSRHPPSVFSMLMSLMLLLAGLAHGQMPFHPKILAIGRRPRR